MKTEKSISIIASVFLTNLFAIIIYLFIITFINYQTNTIKESKVKRK